MRVDLLEETLDRLERDGRRPKFIYTVPTFQNPAGVTLSQPRRRRLVEIARERELLVLEDNPYGLLRYEGEPLPPLFALDGGVYVIYLGTFSKILSPGIRLGWVVAPPPVLVEDQARQAGRRPLHLVAHAADRRGLLRGGPLARLRPVAAPIYRAAARRDARRARRVLPARGRVDAARRRALHLGHAARLHRHGRPAREGAPRGARRVRARRGRVRRRPRRQLDAAQLLRRGRGRDRRGHPPHRQGRRRADRAVRHVHRRAARRSRSQEPRRPWTTNVAAASPTWSAAAAARDSARRAREPRVAVLKGGPLARAAGVAALGRARRGRARAARPRRRRDRRRPGPGRATCATPTPTSRSSRCTGAAARTAPCRSCSRSSACPYTGSGVLACMRCMDKVLTKHLLIEAGHPDAGLLRVQRDRVQGARRRRRAAGDRGAARLPGRGQAGRPGVGARDQVRAHGRRRARGADRRLQLRRPRAARAPRRRARAGVSICWRRPARRCRSSRPSRRSEYFFDFEARYEIGKTEFVCPADLPRRRDGAGAGARARTYRLLGCYGFARVDMILWRRRRAPGARGPGDPRPHRDEPAAAGRRGGRHLVRAAGAAGCSSRRWRERRR